MSLYDYITCRKSTRKYIRDPLRAAIYDKMNPIDMGIGLCHLWLAREKEGIGFSFSAEANPDAEPVRGYEYFGTVRTL